MTTEVHAKGGCIILLDVPQGSAVTLDGITRVTPTSSPSRASASGSSPTDAAPIQRGLWIIGNVHSSSARDDFHLLVVRPGSAGSGDGRIGGGGGGGGGDCRALPVGFVLAPPPSGAAATASLPTAEDLGYEWVFARRYDPTTEEVSSESVDGLTLRNILLAMDEGGELSKFVIPYEQFVGTNSASSSSSDLNGSGAENGPPSWDARTSLITGTFLQRCHGLVSGSKVVPSSDGDPHEAVAGQKNDVDGTSLSYPPIPCIDQSVNARQLAQHSGTRTYLSKLPPEKRTWLLFGAGTSGAAADRPELTNPGEYVWKDVLHRYYSRGNDAHDGSVAENNFLADVELSFLLFLFLECQASMEHWRDAVSMCSLSACDATANIAMQHPRFFQKLLCILHHQMQCIEAEFFQEVEYSSGDDNFMIGALRRLCQACECPGKRKRGGDASIESLRSASHKLRHMALDKFGLDLSVTQSSADNDMELETDALWATAGEDYPEQHESNDGPAGYSRGTREMMDEDSDEEEDDDGPVIIPYEQVEASLARSCSNPSRASERRDRQQQSHREEYPLLYANMTPEEDEVMACARILDEQKDVSLVREAAAYLEEVEAHRGSSF